MIALTLVLAATLVAATPMNLTARQIGPQSGDATYYDVGTGACGVTNVASDSIAAVSHALFDSYPGYAGGNPNNNPICGRTATASYNGRSISFKIEDRCGGCAGFGDLDFSRSAFIALFGSLDAGRVSGVTWSLDGSGGGSPPPPPPPSGCAQSYTAVSGDTCDAIDRKFGITLQTFLQLNPSVNSGCTNLQVGTSYCVKAGGGSGGSCPQRYTAVAGDTCDAIDRKFGITLQQFLQMNPGVNSACTNLQVGTSYCV